MICPICNYGAENVNALQLLNLIETSTYYCPNCGLYFRSPLPSQEAVYRYYTSRYFRYSENIEREMARCQGAFIIQQLQDHRVDLSQINYLEFGAGRGWVLSHLKNTGLIKSAIGIEPDNLSVQWGKENLGVDLKTGMLNEDLLVEIPSKYSETNVISLIHVLEHLHNPYEILGLLRKDLKPHFLFLEVPDAEYEGPVMEIDTFPWSSMGQHFWSFSAKSLCLFLEKQGYQIISFEREGNPHYWESTMERLSLWKTYFSLNEERYLYGDLNLRDVLTANFNLMIGSCLIKIKSLKAPKQTRLDLPIIRILAKSK
ncbi:class I SAM-dependent methyltransferase [Methanoculleus sp.]|uniref:class I SAM-dependent methyltransferase n=1 Tax=Methanoculleus sp. TaxID=90427 RepID=UPI0025CDBEE9|nr:class I SAM-dependent methyltransferase [Methanoculleus sp.]